MGLEAQTQGGPSPLALFTSARHGTRLYYRYDGRVREPSRRLALDNIAVYSDLCAGRTVRLGATSSSAYNYYTDRSNPYRSHVLHTVHRGTGAA